MNPALVAALEDIQDAPLADAGDLSSNGPTFVDPSEIPGTPDPKDVPGGDITELIKEAEAQLEAFYEANPEAIFTQGDAVDTFAADSAAANETLREQVRDMQDTLTAVTGSMEMYALMKSMESVDSVTLAFANATLEDLNRCMEKPAPILELEDGRASSASMEGLLDFIKGGMAKVKNWFKDLFASMEVNGLREQKNWAGVEARINRLFKVLRTIPGEHGKPVGVIQYKDFYTWALFAKNSPLPFDETSLVGAMKLVGDLAMQALDKNTAERLHNVNALSDGLPSLLLSIGDDGGEAATKALLDKIKQPVTLPKLLQYGQELPGGMTFRETPYKSPVTVASWVQPTVESVARVITANNIRRSGRINPPTLDIPVMEKVLEAVLDYSVNRRNMYDNYWGGLVEAYNNAVEAYNKTLAIAQQTNHSLITSEVWRAIDIASYVMMETFNNIINENAWAGTPAFRLADSLVYVIEEQLVRYVKVNR